MAESQLVCMDEAHANPKILESSPAFYYSEQQRAALEALAREGDAAYKERLTEDEYQDFLSAREFKGIMKSLVKFGEDGNEEKEEKKRKKKKREEKEERQPGGPESGTPSLRSTYWPDKSDTDVPPLDIGWPGGGFFRGVTRVTVHTHPPKENGPHLKEVVRKLIQEASKAIAIVMDLLTDLHILQDLLDAAFKRKVPVYIILDMHGVPHFLDMCNRLHVNAQHLQNIRTRTVRGIGLDLSCGRILGSMGSKYMLIDGDKVMFGTYSFSWSASRLDRNMIALMTGQIVDFFDHDFRELYAISEKLDLFKEFHINKPSMETLARVTVPKRPTLPVTSRFQVSLGDAGTLKVPAHKYYNPKYLLAFGDAPGTSGSLPDLSGKKQAEESPEELASLEMTPKQAGSEKLGTLTPGLSLPKKESGRKWGLLKKISKKKDVGPPEGSIPSSMSPASALPNGLEERSNSPEEPSTERSTSRKKRSSNPKGQKRQSNKCAQS